MDPPEPPSDSPPPDAPSTVAPHNQSKAYWGKVFIRVIVLTLVVGGIWHTVDGAREEFTAKGFSPRNLNYGWLAIAGLFYLSGSLPACCFWRSTLVAMGQHPRWLQTIRAYYVGHLGKYVPGKALVVVLRTGLIKSDRVDATVAATSVFVETLTMMAVGAVVAATILAIGFRNEGLLLLLALGLAAAVGIPTLPPIFRRVVRFLQVRRANPAIEAALEGLNFRLMLMGWSTMTVGWLFMGLSLWATLKATPAAVNQLTDPWHDIPLITACAGLAMVAGFLSLIPAGLGPREWVIITLLVPEYGPVAGIVSAVLLRLVWMGAEVLFAGLLYFGIRGESAASGSG
ncbi:MAG TPA: YbhN family protein [Pirellulaceae bacterium]|nr:YbhN family protein [Pirellulaceae bacterium]